MGKWIQRVSVGREGQSVGTFLIDTNSDEACQLPGRGLFPEITRSCFLNACFYDSHVLGT